MGGMPDQQSRRPAQGGVNDSLRKLRAKATSAGALLRIKVRPYYLFHCDPGSRGRATFRTPVWKGIEIIEGLARPHLRAGRPDLRLSTPPRGGGARYRSCLNYLLSASNDSVVLRKL